VSPEVAAAAYHRLIGRYSVPLAPLFADFAGVGAGMRVLDVGCGPGQLTAELAELWRSPDGSFTLRALAWAVRGRR